MSQPMKAPENAGETVILPPGTLKGLKRSTNSLNLKRYAEPDENKHVIILLIRGIVERVELEENGVIVLGRMDSKARNRVEVDLTSYGAADRGVSRAHCQIELHKGDIFVIDLGSTNGTFINGEKLKTGDPTQLRKGDELLLGRLPVQVLFK